SEIKRAAAMTIETQGPWIKSELESAPREFTPPHSRGSVGHFVQGQCDADAGKKQYEGKLVLRLMMWQRLSKENEPRCNNDSQRNRGEIESPNVRANLCEMSRWFYHDRSIMCLLLHPSRSRP